MYLIGWEEKHRFQSGFRYKKGNLLGFVFLHVEESSDHEHHQDDNCERDPYADLPAWDRENTI